jgi:hypothetical protein
MRCIALHTRIPLIQLAVVAPAQIPTNHQSRSLLWPLLAVVVTACVAHPTPADAAGDRQTLVLESASAREFSTNHKVFLEQGTPTTTRVKVKPLIALLFSLSLFLCLAPSSRSWCCSGCSSCSGCCCTAPAPSHCHLSPKDLVGLVVGWWDFSCTVWLYNHLSIYLAIIVFHTSLHSLSHLTPTLVCFGWHTCVWLGLICIATQSLIGLDFETTTFRFDSCWPFCLLRLLHFYKLPV